MSKAYFRKEIPQNAVRDTAGVKIPFVPVSTSVAFIELDDTDPTQARWITELRTVAKSGRLGVSAIDEATYLDMGQKKIPLRSLPGWLGGRGGDGRDEISDQTFQRVMGAPPNQNKLSRANVAPAAGAAKPPAATAPIHIDPRPPVGRVTAQKQAA